MVEKYMLTLFILILISVTAASGHDGSIDLVGRIEQQLSAKIQELEEIYGAEIDALKAESKQREAELVKKIDELDRRVASLEKGNNALARAVQQCRAKSLKNVLTRTRKNGDGIDRTTRALQSDYAIAFSTYLDHDENAVGVGQTIVFNRILLNDGNGYNHHTGVFTAPVTGVYSFTFFIGERADNQNAVELVVNSTKMVDAVAETDNAGEDAQGGNSAIVKVAAGDVVYVRSWTGDHIHSGSSWRFTTFSGFLLYPIDGDTVVVGK